MKAVKANKELNQLHTKSAPDMTEESKKEFAQNLHTQDLLCADEKNDVKKMNAVEFFFRQRAIGISPNDSTSARGQRGRILLKKAELRSITAKLHLLAKLQ